MPRNWRCANGHAWTGDLGALTFCPDCGTADVYEVRPEYHSGEHPALKDAPPPPADDAFGRTFIQMRPHAAGDTFVQAPPRPSGPVADGGTIIQAAPGAAEPAAGGGTIIQVPAYPSLAATLDQ